MLNTELVLLHQCQPSQSCETSQNERCDLAGRDRLRCTSELVYREVRRRRSASRIARMLPGSNGLHKRGKADLLTSELQAVLYLVCAYM